MEEILNLLPLAFVASALAIGAIVHGGVTAMGRNPEASDKIMPLIVMGMAFVEAIAIYALVIALIAKFV